MRASGPSASQPLHSLCLRPPDLSVALPPEIYTYNMEHRAFQPVRAHSPRAQISLRMQTERNPGRKHYTPRKRTIIRLERERERAQQRSSLVVVPGPHRAMLSSHVRSSETMLHLQILKTRVRHPHLPGSLGFAVNMWTAVRGHPFVLPLESTTTPSSSAPTTAGYSTY